MPKVSVDGQNVWYEVKGSGKPIACIGGFALLHDQFEFCTPYMLDAGLQIINWNQRGLGASDWTMVRPYSLDDWVDDLKAVLDDAGIDRAHIWSTSTGSAIGIRFAAKYPEKTKSLITYPWYKTDDYWRRLFQVAGDLSEVFGIRQLSRVFAGVVLPADMMYTDEHIKYETWACGKYEKNVNMTTMRNVMDALANVDLTGDIPRIQCPVFLLMGDDSALNKIEGMESASFDSLTTEFRKLRPDAGLGVVTGASSTYCMITRAEQTTRVLTDFLETL